MATSLVSLTGRVLLPDPGLVAHGSANLISDNAARLISDNAARLISDNAAKLVGNNSGNLISDNASKLTQGATYRVMGNFGLLAAGWTEMATGGARIALVDETGKLLSAVVTADTQGSFSLPPPASPAFLVAEVGGTLGLARLVGAGPAEADLTVDQTLVAQKVASLVRRGRGAAASFLGKPVDDLAREIRAALTPGTLPYLDSGAGEVVDSFDQLVVDEATISSKAGAASADLARRRLEWAVTTIATGSETDPFSLGGYSIHPKTGVLYFMPSNGKRGIGRLAPDGTILPVARLSVDVGFPLSSTVSDAGHFYALAVLHKAGQITFTVYLEEVDLATGTSVASTSLYEGFDPAGSTIGPSDGYSFKMGTIVAASGDVYIPHSLFHYVIRVTPDGKGFVQNPYAGGLGLAAYKDGLRRTEARFQEPVAVTTGPDGALYVCDAGNFVIRRLPIENPDLGEKVKITTFAGSGQKGRESGKARFARFGILDTAAFDPDGNAFVLDSKVNHAVRLVSKAGQVFTVAGGVGEGVRDGIGRHAEFSDARFLQRAPDGTLYLVDRTGPRGTYYLKSIKPANR
jgi:hypothetical protein